jgi:hypothetical protein
MTRIGGMPIFLLSFDIAKNFSTIGRTLPGLQYMTSRTRYIRASRLKMNRRKIHDATDSG